MPEKKLHTPHFRSNFAPKSIRFSTDPLRACLALCALCALCVSALNLPAVPIVAAWSPVPAAAGYEVAWQTNTWQWNYIATGTNTAWTFDVPAGISLRVAVSATNGPDSSPFVFQSPWIGSAAVGWSDTSNVAYIPPITIFTSENIAVQFYQVTNTYTSPVTLPCTQYQYFYAKDINGFNVPLTLKAQ